MVGIDTVWLSKVKLNPRGTPWLSFYTFIFSMFDLLPNF